MFSGFCSTLVVIKADRDGLVTLWGAKERVARPFRSG